MTMSEDDIWTKTWNNLKMHFTTAYNARMLSCGGTMQQGGYHGAANTLALALDDNGDTVVALEQEFASLHVANNMHISRQHRTTSRHSSMNTAQFVRNWQQHNKNWQCS